MRTHTIRTNMISSGRYAVTGAVFSILSTSDARPRRRARAPRSWPSRVRPHRGRQRRSHHRARQHRLDPPSAPRSAEVQSEHSGVGRALTLFPRLHSASADNAAIARLKLERKANAYLWNITYPISVRQQRSGNRSQRYRRARNARNFKSSSATPQPAWPGKSRRGRRRRSDDHDQPLRPSRATNLCG